MTDIQHKSFDVELKADDGGGTFSAYMARFGNVDRAHEVIDIGAFKNLSSFAVDGWVGVNHDMAALPVAIVDSAVQDSRGLLVSAKWHSTPEAQACRAVVMERLAARKSVKCSIGYRVLDSASDVIDGKSVRRLTALEIFEASIVNLPANPAAEVIQAKGAVMAEKVLTLDALKAWVDAMSSKGGRVLSRSNHAQLKSWHKALSDCCSGLKAMIDLHDPDGPDAEPDADPDDKSGQIINPGPMAGKGDRLKELRLRSLRNRFSLASLPKG